MIRGSDDQRVDGHGNHDPGDDFTPPSRMIELPDDRTACPPTA
jgi:hypothetical protein